MTQNGRPSLSSPVFARNGPNGPYVNWAKEPRGENRSIDSEEQAAEMTALRRCLATFSRPHQELLLAPYSGDRPVVTIAEESGKSANALYKLLGRLREKLAACIQKSVAQQPS